MPPIGFRTPWDGAWRIPRQGPSQATTAGPSEARDRRNELFTLTPESPCATPWIACATACRALPLKPALGVRVEAPGNKKMGGGAVG